MPNGQARSEPPTTIPLLEQPPIRRTARRCCQQQIDCQAPIHARSFLHRHGPTGAGRLHGRHAATRAELAHGPPPANQPIARPPTASSSAVRAYRILAIVIAATMSVPGDSEGNSERAVEVTGTNRAPGFCRRGHARSADGRPRPVHPWTPHRLQRRSNNSRSTPARAPPDPLPRPVPTRAHRARTHRVSACQTGMISRWNWANRSGRHTISIPPGHSEQLVVLWHHRCPAPAAWAAPGRPAQRAEVRQPSGPAAE